MKPSELIKVLQQAIDAGLDDETKILFDVCAKSYNVHVVDVNKAYFESRGKEMVGYPYIILVE